MFESTELINKSNLSVTDPVQFLQSLIHNLTDCQKSVGFTEDYFRITEKQKKNLRIKFNDSLKFCTETAYHQEQLNVHVHLDR